MLETVRLSADALIEAFRYASDEAKEIVHDVIIDEIDRVTTEKIRLAKEKRDLVVNELILSYESRTSKKRRYYEGDRLCLKD